MTAPSVQRVDHVHLTVPDRAAVVPWYVRVLGLEPMPKLASWADGGPLMLTDRHAGAITLAVFESPEPSTHTAVAFGTDAAGFMAWRAHLDQLEIDVRVTDHGLAWSLYFSDPVGNGFEVTTYEHAAVSALLEG